MNGIHKKSALSETGEIILAAHDQGEGLFWERYERQLPLCGFTRNGLSCRKCFKGPCRINPFGDEPSRGICGADRDQIVMENVFSTTLAGVLETARDLSLMDSDTLVEEIPDLSSDLPRETRRRLTEQGLLPVRKADLFGVQNSYFSHKNYLSKTLKDLTRLGLIQYGLLGQARAIADQVADAEASVGEDGFNILVVGQAPLGLLKGLRDRAVQHSGDGAVHILVQGSHAIPGIESMGDHGDPELALAMNVDALVVTPNGCLPGLEALAQKYDVPTVLVDGAKSLDQLVSETMTVVRGQKGGYVSGTRVHRRSGLETELHEFLHKRKEMKAALKRGTIKGVVVLLGEANVKQAFFERTLTLMESCLDNRVWVLVGGELGAQGDLLTEEIQRRMGDRFSRMEIDGFCPPTCFGSFSQITLLVPFFKDLMEGESFASTPGVIAFPEFFRASTWATAVGLLSLGFMVQIGSSLPFWGSPALTEVLLKDWPDLSGGRLLASPAVPDGETQAREIFSHLSRIHP
jgi:hypothetical protein